MLPLVILLVSSCACSGPVPKPSPKPPRPTLESLTPAQAPGLEGGICMDKQDTTKLLNYMDALERRP